MKTLFLDEICEIIGARCNSNDIERMAKVCGVSTDSRTTQQGEIFFAIKGERFDGHDFVASALERGAVAAVVEKDIELFDSRIRDKLLYVDDVLLALGRLASYYRDELTCTVIAVTGSNGKTTTKEMIYHILSKRYAGYRSPKSFNNHIGVPLTILQSDTRDEFLIAELGTNHPGEIDYLGDIVRPDIAVITQIGEAHLEGFGSLERIASEKASLVKYVREGGAIIANGDNPMLLKLISHPEATIFSFGISEENDMRVSDIVQEADGLRFRVNERFEFFIPIIGRHNAINCLAAITVARRMGFDMEEIRDAIRDFKMPEMRLNVLEIEGVTFINDCYNANPVSVLSALDVLDNFDVEGKKIFCFGQMFELGRDAERFHCDVAVQIGKSGTDVLIAVGEFGPQIKREAIKSGFKEENCFVAESSDRAGEILREIARRGDVVLIKGSRAMKMEKILGYWK